MGHMDQKYIILRKTLNQCSSPENLLGVEFPSLKCTLFHLIQSAPQIKASFCQFRKTHGHAVEIRDSIYHAIGGSSIRDMLKKSSSSLRHTTLRDWSLITGRGGSTKLEGGHVKFSL